MGSLHQEVQEDGQMLDIKEAVQLSVIAMEGSHVDILRKFEWFILLVKNNALWVFSVTRFLISIGMEVAPASWEIKEVAVFLVEGEEELLE